MIWINSPIAFLQFSYSPTGVSAGAMRAGFLKYLDLRLPRYTSYPTAVQFGPGVDASVHERWLTALPADAPVSLYLHVPFCTELCLYCGCHTTVARRYQPIAAYAEVLAREINLVGEILARPSVTQIHWGGGTPSILRPQDLRQVTETLRANFNITPATETAIEIDPRSLTPGGVEAMREIGVTRASLGVQDFEERVQQAIGRVQSFEQTARATDALREAGISSINLDLMYGLPHQTEATVARSVARALTLRPDRIALFGYAHVPWMKRHQRLIPEDALPGTGERFAQSSIAAEIIVSAGYRRIGLDHFAADSDLLSLRQGEGRLHRNFQGYTTDETPNLIGFGPSAIGSLPDGYVQNAVNMVAYRGAIAAGQLPTARGLALDPEDRLRRQIIERLMCDLAVDIGAVCVAHHTGVNHLAAELSEIDRLAADGIVERSGTTIKVPERARPLVRAVCAVFDQYASNSEARFSRAS